MARKIVGRNKVIQVPRQLTMVLIVEAFDGRLLDCPVHWLELPVRPFSPKTLRNDEIYQKYALKLNNLSDRSISVTRNPQMIALAYGGMVISWTDETAHNDGTNILKQVFHISDINTCY